MEEKRREAVAFFKSEKAYQRLFTQMRKKYESLGRIGGTIPVRQFSHEELSVIAGFYGVTVEFLLIKKSISIQKFENQLQETRFAGINLKELLDAYFGEKIISRKQSTLDKKTKLNNLLQDLKVSYTDLSFWIEHIKSGAADSRWIVRLATDEPERFQDLTRFLALAIKGLPSEVERLPMFSQRITGDPHAFDLEQDLGKMFLHVLSIHAVGVENEVVVPTGTEEINDLLQRYHIYRDDLLNFVTCANFYAERLDGTIHPVWQAATECHSVQNIPLRELLNLGRIFPYKGSVVWIVENSGVCSALLDQVDDVPIICTNGQFKLAALILMDLLVKDGCRLHYAGDFDPEGLGMAQRLLNRYPDHAVLWYMDLRAYKKSNPVKPLTQERLEKLNGITDNSLLEVADVMRKIGKAGYQEALVDLMIKDILHKAETI